MATPSQDTVSRYAPGGDIYAQLQASYGTSAAEKVYAAEQSGVPGATAEALGEVRNGPPLDASTADAFWNQITTDPLGAPIDSLNSLLKSVTADVFGHPFVLVALTVGAIAAFAYFGGFKLLKR